MEKIQVRPALPEDFETVYDFINALENDIFDREIQRQIYTENLANAANIYLIASAADIAVGFLSCHVQRLLHHGGAIGEIQELFVNAEARNLGAGKKLTDKLKEIAKDRGIVQLEVTSSFKREDAHRFYEREDFAFTHKKFVYKLNKIF